jgi:uncharacterized protein (UPF0548 family)
MFLLTEPSTQVIREFIATRRDSPFSYSAVGATNAVPPREYTLDHNRVQLGLGNEVYERAVEALRRWRQFDLGWVKIVPAGSRVEVGTTVAVQAHTFGLWSLSACRIVYLISDEGPIDRFGFAYGTLPDHVERGEERFTIEWHREDNSVWYDILAFSRPRHPLVRIAFPLARMLQKRFVRDSLSVMTATVRE